MRFSLIELEIFARSRGHRNAAAGAASGSAKMAVYPAIIGRS